MEAFRVPAEPSPLPSFSSGSDEESFVVLGKSLCDVDRTPRSGEQRAVEVQGMSILEETKKLIKEELSAIEGKISGTSQRIGESDIAANRMRGTGADDMTDGKLQHSQSSEEKPAGASSFSSTDAKERSVSVADGVSNKNLLQHSQMAMSSEEKPAGASSSFGAKEQAVSVTEADDVSNKNLLQNSQMAGSSEETPAPASSLSSTDAKQQSVSFPKLPLLDRTFESVNSAISIATFTSDLTSEEVQNKIAQIIEENINLKDTILRNNQSLNAQYERIIAWQQDVQKVHQSHKDKIYEAKSVIEKLKKENDLKAVELRRMRENLDNKDQEIAELHKKMASMKIQLNEKLTQSSESNLKEFDLDIAQKKIRDLEMDMQKMTLENLTLKEETQKLKGCGKNSDYEKRIEELEEQLKCSKYGIEQLETELAAVKFTASQKETGLTTENNALRSQLINLTQLQTDLVRPEELSNLKQQLQVTQMNLVQAEQTRAEAYKQIQMLTRQVEALNLQKMSMEGPTKQDDEIFALQTQLELYKADFEAEHSSNENMKAEKEKLLEDLQNLQRRNQQLLDEIDEMRRDGGTYPRRRPTPSSSITSTTPSAPNDHSFQCPKCSFVFKDLQSLQNHVYRCIDIDESLP